MKKIIDRIHGYLKDKRMERKERTLAEKRAALEETYAYIAPVATVATMTAMALSGNFSFI